MAQKKLTIPADMRGEEGLLAAVLLTALKDVDGRNPGEREDARRYFAGPEYRDHLSWLGLPANLLPQPITAWARGEAQ